MKLLCKIRNCWKCFQLQIASIMSTSDNMIDFLNYLSSVLSYNVPAVAVLCSRCWVEEPTTLQRLYSHLSLANPTKSDLQSA